MRSHTLSLVKDLHGGRCGSHFHQLLDQRVGHRYFGILVDAGGQEYLAPGRYILPDRLGRAYLVSEEAVLIQPC
jgi:hypothetical protein